MTLLTCFSLQGRSPTIMLGGRLAFTADHRQVCAVTVTCVPEPSRLSPVSGWLRRGVMSSTCERERLAPEEMCALLRQPLPPWFP